MQDDKINRVAWLLAYYNICIRDLYRHSNKNFLTYLVHHHQSTLLQANMCCSIL